MGRGSEKKIFQRKYTVGQQTLEKELNITNHKENANQNQYLSEWLLQKGQELSVDEDVVKREPWFTVGGNITWYTTVENSIETAKKN